MEALCADVAELALGVGVDAAAMREAALRAILGASAALEGRRRRPRATR